MNVKNITNIPQIFYNRYGQPVTLLPTEVKNVDTERGSLYLSPELASSNHKPLDKNYDAKNKKPRVLFIMTSNYIGGAEILFINLINKIKYTYDCYLATVYERSDTGFIYEFPCPFFSVGHILPHNTGTAFGYLAQLLNADLIVSTNIVTHVRKGIKSIVECPIIDVSHAEQGMMYVYPEKEPFVQTEKIDCMITVNQRTLTFVRKQFGDRLKFGACIENGIDINKFSPIAKKAKSGIIGNAARISGEKNPQRFNNIASLLPDKKFKWIGGVNPECYTFSCGINWASNTELTGYMTNTEVIKALHTLDIFMLTSINEGMPLAVLEAMSCGIPVISTNVGNMSKLIHEDCIYENDRQAVNLINRLYKDEAFYKQCCIDNRKKIEALYSLDVMADKYKAIFNKFLKG